MRDPHVVRGYWYYDFKSNSPTSRCKWMIEVFICFAVLQSIVLSLLVFILPELHRFPWDSMPENFARIFCIAGQSKMRSSKTRCQENEDIRFRMFRTSLPLKIFTNLDNILTFFLIKTHKLSPCSTCTLHSPTPSNQIGVITPKYPGLLTWGTRLKNGKGFYPLSPLALDT